jgi:hypothetical protein
MTQLGIVHLLSALYLSAVICFMVSLNENRQPRRILRETFRRWAKFLIFTLAIGLVVYWMG